MESLAEEEAGPGPGDPPELEPEGEGPEGEAGPPAPAPAPGAGGGAASGGYADAQRAALKELYAATGGPTWYSEGSRGWADAGDGDFCDWAGVWCCGEKVEVRGACAGFLGLIPGDNETSLADGNDCREEVPQLLLNGLEVCEHDGVAGLALQNRNLTGTLPESAFAALAPTLQLLFMYNNRLRGPLPEALGDMDQLQVLMVNGNFLTGDIPPLPPSLRRINLSFNLLNGTANYDQLSRLTEVRELDIANNQLSGEISRPYLDAVRGHYEERGEPVPACFAGARNSAICRMANMGVPFYWNMPHLAILDVSQNSFTGEVPSLFPLASTILNTLDCPNLPPANSDVPRTVEDFLGCEPPTTTTISLDLSQNRLSGEFMPLPEGERELIEAVMGIRLVNFSLERNLNVTGHIPDWFGSLNALTAIAIASTKIFSLPPTINGTMQDLGRLDAGNNPYLTEVSFEKLAQITNIGQVQLAATNLTSQLPETLPDRWRPSIDLRDTWLIWDKGPNSRGENLPEYFRFAMGTDGKYLRVPLTLLVDGQLTVQPGMSCPMVIWDCIRYPTQTGETYVSQDYQDSLLYSNAVMEEEMSMDDETACRHSRARSAASPYDTYHASDLNMQESAEIQLSPIFYGYQNCECISGYVKKMKEEEGRRFANASYYDGVHKVAVCEKVNVGAIVGGAFGAFVAVAVVLGMYFGLFRKKSERARLLQRKKRGPPMEGEPLVVVATDVEGSTELWEWDGDVMSAATDIHDKLLRRLLPKYFGYEVHTEGDSFLCAFHEPMDAVRWALTVQHALLLCDWPERLDYGPHASTEYAKTPGAARRAGTASSSRSASRTRSASSQARARDGEEWEEDSGENSMTSALENTRVLYHGLRVRMGICTGEAEAVVVEERNHRVAYRGGIAELVPKMADLAPGGSVLIDGPTYQALTTRGLQLAGEEPGSSRFLGFMGRGGGRDSSTALDLAGLGLAGLSLSSRASGQASSMYFVEKNKSNNFYSRASGRSRFSNLKSRASSRAPQSRAASSFDAAIANADNRAAVLNLGVALVGGKLIDVTAVSTTSLAPRFIAFMNEMQISRDSYCTNGFFQAPLTQEAVQATGPGFFVGDFDPRATALPDMAIAFTGIEDFGSIAKESPALAEAVLLQQEQILRLVALRFGGTLCQQSNESLMFAFWAAEDALAFGLACQLAFHNATWPKGTTKIKACREEMADGLCMFQGPRLKVGVFEGQPTATMVHPTLGRPDYFGPLVNRAARIAYGVALGGQVVTELSTAMEVMARWQRRKGSFHNFSTLNYCFADHRTHTVALREVGEFKFKGVSQPVKCANLVLEDFRGRSKLWSKSQRARDAKVASVQNGGDSESASRISQLAASAREGPRLLQRAKSWKRVGVRFGVEEDARSDASVEVEPPQMSAKLGLATVPPSLDLLETVKFYCAQPGVAQTLQSLSSADLSGRSSFRTFGSLRDSMRESLGRDTALRNGEHLEEDWHEEVGSGWRESPPPGSAVVEMTLLGGKDGEAGGPVEPSGPTVEG